MAKIISAAVGSIPSLSGIEDNATRSALQAVVDMLNVRNGQTGSGAQRFITAADLEALKTTQSQMASAVGLAIDGLGNVKPRNDGYDPLHPVNPADVVDMLVGQVRTDHLFQALGDRINLIDTPTTGLVDKVSSLYTTYGSTSSAAASAGAAATSASNAASSESNALTYANNAQGYSNTAQGYMTSANGYMTSAQYYSVLTSSTVGDSLFANPNFTDWTGGLPAGFTNWGAVGATKETSITRYGVGNAMRFSATGTTDAGVVVLATTAPEYTYLTVSVDFYLVSGALGGSGLLVDWVGSSPAYVRDTIDFSAEVPSPVAGKWYTVRKVIQRPSSISGFSSYRLYVMANYGGIATKADKDIIFGKVIVSPASATDVATIGNTSSISALSTTVTNNYATQGSQITTLNSTVGTLSTSLSTEATTRANADGDLQAQYTVKIDANGYISGYGLASTSSGAAPYSQFYIRADRFAVGDPATPSGSFTPRVPFIVQSGQVYMDIAMIKDATITTAKIADASITTAKIGSAEVKTANIDNLAVTTGKINDLAVNTLQLAGQAVTIPVSTYVSTASPSGGVETTIASVSMTNTGAPVAVLASATFRTAAMTSGSPGVLEESCTFNLYRDTTLLDSAKATEFGYYDGSGMTINDGVELRAAFVVSTTASAGSHTYYLKANLSNGTCKNISVVALETKK